ncbi:MAG: glycosyltransferase [Planctomycetes bacterium]|nr:glycosyltransferase [Planctomycetota bacterium]
MRLVRILTRPNLGGPMQQAIALWHAHRALGVQTLLVTGVVDGAETAVDGAAAGLPILAYEEACRLGPAAAGWVVLPHLRRGLAPWRDVRAGQALRHLLRRVRPDVVHTHTSKAGWLGRRAAMRCGVPWIVHTFHGHVLQDYFGWLGSAWMRALERRLAARTDVLVAVSDSCAEELAAAGVAGRGRFQVVPPAVPLPALLPRAVARSQLGIPPAQVRLACVGRLVPIKRVEHFVDLLAGQPTWHGDVFGDGPLRAELAARIAARAAGRVHLRGAVPAVAGLLPAYDALVVPSVREGCPLVAVEAFAAGVPVVGYDVPGVHDALAQGRGVLVPAAAGVPGLAAAVAATVAEPARVAACTAAARGAIDRFEPSAVARRLLALYDLRNRGGGRYDAAPSG